MKIGYKVKREVYGKGRRETSRGRGSGRGEGVSGSVSMGNAIENSPTLKKVTRISIELLYVA